MFMDLNKEFQSKTSKIHVLYCKISQVYKTILDCYIKQEILNTQTVDQIQYRNPHNFVKLEDIYLGPAVTIALPQIENLDTNELHQFRLKCLDFYVEAAHDISLYCLIVEQLLRDFFSGEPYNKTKLRNALETDSINGIKHAKRLFLTKLRVYYTKANGWKTQQ